LGGYKFRRQYPVGPYILDFICHEERLVIEVDGSQHLSAKSESKDQERSRFLAQLGLRVLRFDNRQVLLESNGVLSSILAALNPSTYPLPKERESEANPKRIRGFV
jgi:type I restriction enzyme M protein